MRLLFTDGLVTPRDLPAASALRYRALFGICLYTGCRVSEALALQTTDMKSGTITFSSSTLLNQHLELSDDKRRLRIMK